MNEVDECVNGISMAVCVLAIADGVGFSYFWFPFLSLMWCCVLDVLQIAECECERIRKDMFKVVFSVLCLAVCVV